MEMAACSSVVIIISVDEFEMYLRWLNGVSGFEGNENLLGRLKHLPSNLSHH